MLQFPPWKIALIVGIVLWGCLLALPNLFSDTALGIEPVKPETDDPQIIKTYQDDLAAAQASNWPGVLPTGKLNLGLDLQGGVFLLIEIDPSEVAQNRLSIVSRDVLDALRKNPRIGHTRPIEDGVMKVTLRDPADMDEALRRIRGINSVIQGSLANERMLQIEQSGARTIDVTITSAARSQLAKEAQDKTKEIVRRRVDPDGVAEISVVPQGDNRIILEAPGEDNPQRLKLLLGQAGRLVFSMVDSGASAVERPGWRFLPMWDGNGRLLVSDTPIVTGADIRNASQGFDEGGRPQINFTLNGSGVKKFSDTTVRFPDEIFAIVLDDRIMSAPRINEPIFGAGVRITGDFEIEEAIRLAAIIEAGELPAKLDFIEERTVDPSLGKDSIRAGTAASLIGLALVAVFMILAYGLLGVFAVISLAANIILILGGLSGLGATLTLPGIAGIILTIGMAVDANVLVFERVREEYRNGRSPVTAVQAGYERALSTILDANITTLIAAGVLYTLAGSGPVKGFATTLGLGIVTSVFTAFVVTRLMTAMWLRTARPKTLSV